MAQVITTTFQFKRGLAATWKEKNLVLSAGEPGFELDTNLLKVGDGTTPWNSLPYLSGSSNEGAAVRQETAEEYAEKANTFIPVKNELCVVIFNDSSTRLKIGNGTTVWSDLPYVNGDAIKLYDTTGKNTDGTMTQKAITDELDKKVGTSMNEESETLTFI